MTWRNRKWLIAGGLAVLLAAVVAKRSYDYNSNLSKLLEAVKLGDPATVDRVLASGADLNAHRSDGMTPLLYAMLTKNKPSFLRLLEGGSDANRPLTGSCVRLGSSVTHIAAKIKDDPYWLEAILKHGGKPNLVAPGHFHTTAIFDAIQRGNIAALEALIREGADLNYQDEFGSPPLIDAAFAFWFQGVYHLLEAGADYTVKNEAGFDIAAVLVHNDVPPKPEARRWRAKAILFLDKKGVNWQQAKKKCAEKGLKTLDVDAELKWAGLR